MNVPLRPVAGGRLFIRPRRRANGALRTAPMGLVALAVVAAAVVGYLSHVDARPVAGAAVLTAVAQGPALTSARPLKVMTFNIRHAEGLDGRVSTERIAEVIRASGADVVGLQEVDRRLPRSGWQDQVRQIATRLGYDYAFGRNLGAGPVGFGNAILSRYPIAGRENLALPGRLEPRGALVVTIDVGPKSPVTFIDTHLGLSTADRQTQLGAIVEDLRKLIGPVILVGDFNDPPGAPEQAKLTGLLHDSYAGSEKVSGEGTFGVEAGKPGERIDFVWLSPDLKSLSWSAVPSQASDHLPVVVEVAPASR